MTLYRILLFLHVVAAVLLLGPLFAHPLVKTFRGSPIIPNVLKIEEALARLHVIGVVVMLVTGGWLIFESPVTDDFGEVTWLHISLVLFVAWAGVTTGGLVPALRKARATHEQGGDDAATPLLDLVDNRWIPIASALVAMLIFFMVYKPFS